MFRVLGVDPSLNGTGICRVDLHQWPPSASFRQPDEPSLSRTIDVTTLLTSKPKLKTKREYSRRVTQVIDQVETWLDGVDLVAMEGLAYSAKGEAVWVLPWIFGRIIDLCEKHDKDLIVVGTTQVKKYTTGKGNSSKEVALLATLRRFPVMAEKVTNNNEADALVCAAVGCRWKGLPIDTVPKDHWMDVMKKIAS